MELSKYTTGIIFVDDKKEQVQSLINYCKSKSIKTMYINPEDFNLDNLYVGYRIVFVDLAFDNGIVDVDRVTNIIRGISENGEKHLLVVAWTQHENDIVTLKNKIEEKMVGNLPIAILNAQKSRMLYIETEEEFNNLIAEIFNTFENDNKNLFNLLEWEENYFKSIREEFDNLIEKSYSNVIDPKLIDKNLGLFAQKTLIPQKILSAFEILNTKVNDNVLSKINSMNNYVLEYDNNLISLGDKLKFNCGMLFEKNINNIDMPGSLYKISEYDYAKLNNLSLEHKSSGDENVDDLFIKLQQKNIEFDYIYHIVLNITPNCTFASKNKNTTYCEGYLIVGTNDYQVNLKKIHDLKGYSKQSLEKCAFSYIDENDIFSHLIICFDLCCSSINNDYEKIFQLKNNIKINIQQKFSSFVNRVGDNIYEQ